MSDKIDANDVARDEGPEGLAIELERLTDAAAPISLDGKKDATPPAPRPKSTWPAPMRSTAFHGLAGDIVRTIGPHTEADSAALLVHFLIAIGNRIGNEPQLRHGNEFHRANLFGVIVGASSTGKKGTAWKAIKRLFDASDDKWFDDRIKNGLSSGEGMINAVRDANETIEGDEGVKDKRLLIVESEYSGVLKQTTRDGNILSDCIRLAWDGDTLSTLTKHTPLKATRPHISIIGHITEHELTRRMTDTECANGFANRFLWVCSKRSKELPEGGNLSDGELAVLRGEINAAVQFAIETTQPWKMSVAAADVWGRNDGRKGMYSVLSSGGAGLADSICARAPQHVLKMALIYAILDCVKEIEPTHLRAAYAVWRYCEQSVRHIFGDKLGDSTADAILDALREASTGLTRSEIREIFTRNKSSAEIEQALSFLKEHGKADFKLVPTDGRPTERWFAI